MSQFHRPTQNFLLGKSQPVLAFADNKLVVLTAQLSLLTVFICLLYLAIDLRNGIYDSWFLQTLGAILSLISFTINRKGHHYWAKVLLLIAGTLTVFSFALLEPVQIGVCFLFIICYIVAIAGLGFEHRKTAAVMFVFTTVLIIFSVIIDLGLITRRVYSLEYIKINLTINFIVTSATTVLIVYFLMNLNYYSESSLRENEKAIQEKNEELIKVNNELDRFVYSTSHDLRSPIRSIQGLICLTKYTNDLVELKSYLVKMESWMIHLDKFINDISNYSRNSRLPLNLVPVKIKQIVLETLENLQFYPGADKIQVEINVPEELVIESDTTRVQIIIGNLISNAFKYTDQTKDHSFIHINAYNIVDHIEILIEDNGIGIHAEYASKIFDMFFQGHEKSDGSGLGLYIVKETLEKIQGTLSVESELGKGSVFKVIFPKVIEV